MVLGVGVGGSHATIMVNICKNVNMGLIRHRKMTQAVC